MGKKVVIVDYGVGNISSIKNMLKKMGVGNVSLASSQEEIEDAEKIILPGVGSYDYGMRMLAEKELIEVLNKKVLIDKTPILGICLGAQLLAKKSDEGLLPGLGWIDAEVKRFKIDAGSIFKIPHMGWNEVEASKESKLLEGLPPEAKFYFVHSYHIVCANLQDELLKAHYSYNFTAAVEHENILGVQFHPEKSHKYGMKLLENFANNY